MPSTVRSLLNGADLTLDGVVRWGQLVPSRETGVYIIALTSRAHQYDGRLPACPIAMPSVRQLLVTRPELTLDGKRPTAQQLADRIASFWMPDEVVLYIGKTDASLGRRTAQYYSTELGKSGPHAGGWYLKTLGNLSELYVYYSHAEAPVEAESLMLGSFVSGASVDSKRRHFEPGLPLPFANMEWCYFDETFLRLRRLRRLDGIKGTKGD